jgi:hypothetical protein
MNRIRLVQFDMNNRIFGPYSAVLGRILISVMEHVAQQPVVLSVFQVEDEDEAFEDEFLSDVDPSILHFLLARWPLFLVVCPACRVFCIDSAPGDSMLRRAFITLNPEPSTRCCHVHPTTNE